MNLESVIFREVLAEWRRNYGSRGHPDYKPLCTYVKKYVRGKLRTNYDLHYVNPCLSDGGVADVAFYVMKYMMKPSNRAIRLQQALRMNLPEDEYDDLWSLVRPRHFESEALGLGQCVVDMPEGEFDRKTHYVVAKPILEHLRQGIRLSKSNSLDNPIPSFFSPEDGRSHPLAKYYKGHPDIFNMSDFLDFFYASQQNEDNVIVHDDKHISQLLKQEDDFNKKVENVSFNQTASELDEVFDDFDDNDFIEL